MLIFLDDDVYAKLDFQEFAQKHINFYKAIV